MSTYLAERRRFQYLVVVLILLTIADGLISQFLIAHGLGWEGNPLLQGLVGEWNVFPVKAGGTLLASVILWDIFRRQPKVGLFGAAFCVLLYTGIVYWNIGVLLFASAYF